MRLAKVIGNVVATRKEDSLTGLKLLVIEEIDAVSTDPKNNRLVAVDTLGAGVGDIVLWVQGGAARMINNVDRYSPLDVAVVGIVDSVDVQS